MTRGWFWRGVLKCIGWKTELTAPRRDKCVICVAPHTSNWDFILGELAYKSVGRKANFLMKEAWFFFPLKYLLRAMGGIPVRRRGKGASLTDQVISDFRHRDYMNLAVTPEGTRSATATWHSGFLYMAIGAGVPVQLGVIDYRRRLISITEEFMPSGDVEADMHRVKDFYADKKDAARYPDKFKL